MFCNNCGSKLEDNARYCNVCGEAVSTSEGRINRRKNYKRAATFIIIYRLLSVIGITAALVIPLILNVYILESAFGIDLGYEGYPIQASDSTKDNTAPKVTKAPEVKKRTGPIKVGIINIDPNASSDSTANCNDIKNMVEREGYDARYAYSMKNEEQIRSAEQFIDDGVDYLIISAADASGWEPVLQQAKEQGIKVILFGHTINVDKNLYEASIVSDMRNEGKKAVEWLESHISGSCNIIHIQGVMDSEAQQGRSEPLNEAASSNGWNIVEQQTAEWDYERARQIVRSVISSGQNFNVIYAEDDYMAKGAVEALDAAGISHGAHGAVTIISFGGYGWALQNVKDGEWSCDIQVNPYYGYYIKEVIGILESGKQLKNKKVIIEDKLFDHDNITDQDINRYGI